MKYAALRAHPAADAFPRIDGADYDAMVEDVRSHGLRNPVWLFDGAGEWLVLDGRNRIAACVAAGVPIKHQVYDGKDPIGFVVSCNLRRRHMSESQRSMVAAKLATLGNGRPGKTAPIGALSKEAAAKTLNVGTKSVERAKQVLANGAPELVSAVEQGKVSVSAAALATKLPPEAQREAVRTGKVREAIKPIVADEWDENDEIAEIRGFLDDRVERWQGPTIGLAMALHVYAKGLGL